MESIKLLTLSMLLMCCMVAGDGDKQSANANINKPNTSLAGTAGDDVTYTEIIPIRFTWNRYTIIATAAAAVVVVAGLVASASLLLPLITYKICYLFGACNYGLDTYVDRFVATDANLGPEYPVYTGNNREKRSLEHLGPIIQTLAAAYEKYGEEGVDGKKKFEETRMADSIFAR